MYHMSMTSAYSASLPLCSESRATAAASVPVWQLATAPAMAADIWRACERDQVEELKEALDSGVDCNAQNQDGWTLAHAAAHGGSVRCLQLLISRGANLDIVDKKGRTLVHEAAQQGRLSALKILKNKAQFNQRDADGYTPWDLSTHASVRALLTDVNKYSKSTGESTKERAAASAGKPNPGSSKAQGKFKGQEYRRVPFSVKKKKEQLQQKRAQKLRQNEEKTGESSRDFVSLDGKVASKYGESQTGSANLESRGTRFADKTRSLFSVFQGQNQEELKKLKLDSSRPLEYRYPANTSSIQPCNLTDVGQSVEFPKRPEWNYEMSAEELQQIEEEYFQGFLENLRARYSTKDLNFFEQNLNVWRQLWRLIERSDILLLLLDARIPLLHYNSHLVHHIQDEMHKKVILVLTKCDLVPRECVNKWIRYLKNLNPGIEVIVTSAPPNASASGDAARYQINQDRVFKQRRESKHVILSAVAKSCERMTMSNGRESTHSIREILLQDAEFHDLINAQEISENEDWGEEPLKPLFQYKEMVDNEYYPIEDVQEDEEADEGDDELVEQDTPFEDEDETKSPLDAIVRIGMIGHPNMGKSSLINALMGKKIVSVSKTPGHTKHLQTLFLSRHCMLVDGPGLVFPRIGTSPGILVTFGLIPIAQVRELFSVVRYLAENAIPRIEKYYELQIPTSEAIDAKPISNGESGNYRGDSLMYDETQTQACSAVDNFQWSPVSLCEAFAEKHSWSLARSGRPDAVRAANTMLRAALAGTGLYLAFLPPQEE